MPNRTVPGPASYENWKAYERCSDLAEAVEFPLYIDSLVFGQALDGYGPYKFLNTIQSGQQYVATAPIDHLDPAVVVRASVYADWHGFVSFEDSAKTDATGYHGGQLNDEIAALLSLLLGTRVLAGPTLRRFTSSDPLGSPYYGFMQPVVHGTSHTDRRIIPDIPYEASLGQIALLQLLPCLDPATAVALIKAARMYQQALWLAEYQPHLTWLMLVSAVETAANQWRRRQGKALDRLRYQYPDLVEALEAAGGQDLVQQVARTFADSIGSTKKFVDFLVTHLPEPPLHRPIAWAQVDWSEASITKTLRNVYGHRSKALHEGIQFPAPMCRPPLYMNGWAAPAEKPPGNAAATGGGFWRTEDTAMLLRTFEYIVRSALRSWWTTLAPVVSSAC